MAAPDQTIVGEQLCKFLETFNPFIKYPSGMTLVQWRDMIRSDERVRMPVAGYQLGFAFSSPIDTLKATRAEALNLADKLDVMIEGKRIGNGPTARKLAETETAEWIELQNEDLQRWRENRESGQAATVQVQAIDVYGDGDGQVVEVGNVGISNRGDRGAGPFADQS